MQIPCIERNAVAAMRAINALSLAKLPHLHPEDFFDMVVKTMYETGRDLFSKYRETARVVWRRCIGNDEKPLTRASFPV